MKFPSLFLLLILFNYIFFISKCLASEGTQIGNTGEQGESTIGNFSFRMPSFRPTHNDAYFCLEMKVESAMSIVDYHGVLDHPVIHQINIFGVEQSFYDILPKSIIENISMNRTIDRSSPLVCDAIIEFSNLNLFKPIGRFSVIFVWTKMTPNGIKIPEGDNHWL